MIKILLLQDLRNNGGTRQAMKLVETNGMTNLTIGLIVPNIFGIKPMYQLFKDLYYYFFSQKSFKKLKLISKKLTASEDYLIISTSKKTLLYVSNIDSKYHTHYCQHIEVWELYNSAAFIKCCEDKGYLNPKMLLSFIKNNIYLSPGDFGYFNSLGRIKSFYTVSDFLKSILSLYNPTASIKNIPVTPHIKNFHGKEIKKISGSILFFLRGNNMKGDNLILKLIFSDLSQKKIILVLSYRPRSSFIKKLKIHNIDFYIKPTDIILSEIYSVAETVIHPSLCEGFGSVPQEAIQFNCKVIASKTGWLYNSESSLNIRVVKRHRTDDYVKETISI